jgi:ferredoxin
MAKKPRASAWVWARRTTQTIVLLLFLYLFLQAVYHPINVTGGHVTLFFELDPLVLISSWLASHAVVRALLLSLITLVVTLIFGRWFCGWFCPFGTLHHLFTALRGGLAKAKLETGGYGRWQKAKYYVLAALLAGMLVGVNLAGWLDPFSFFYRGLTAAVFPAADAGIRAAFGWIYQANPGVGSLRVTAVSEPVYDVLSKYFLAVKQPHYAGGVLIGFLFAGIVALNFYRARFWCRYLCPLGALLGLAGKNPVVRFARNQEQCNNCRLCLADCQGGALSAKAEEWKPAECFYCFNCQSDCPTEAITLVGPRSKVQGLRSARSWLAGFARPPKQEKLDLGRRELLAAGLTGLGGGLLFRVHPQASKRSFHPALIRPPGAISEDEFLTKCARCGECMKVCPTNAIHPTAFEAGLEGLWSPVLNFKIGYCEYECTLCTQVCPTKAIRELSVEEKKKTKIGLAFFDQSRCLPYAFARTCIVCEEHCPTPKKAIWFEEVRVVNHRGELVTVKQPRIDPELCIGCGICEQKCPIKDRAGVYVTSAGETRNPENNILLPEASPYGAS